MATLIIIAVRDKIIDRYLDWFLAQDWIGILTDLAQVWIGILNGLLQAPIA